MSETLDHAATVATWTDEQLIDTWETASEEETENPSGLLLAVIEEMGKREISF
ncbi:hypothetical protein KFK14_19600 [Sphingobium phenoxybenzoativorans]|uniref:Uncharacterized protein n=1 Tax=Sphingobium phenoxybenzoativorans TaxID=1592790 RepID=A0A975K6V7_9SPHN|nr:hypothetical protein [Sphingobium phenoxybenzoativorans]QUT05178.1 hypothetical protein KFK14_19600 [Sphingobium phenoxybenzoativorans]